MAFFPCQKSKIRSKRDPIEAGQIRLLWLEASGLEEGTAETGGL